MNTKIELSNELSNVEREVIFYRANGFNQKVLEATIKEDSKLWEKYSKDSEKFYKDLEDKVKRLQLEENKY